MYLPLHSRLETRGEEKKFIDILITKKKQAREPVILSSLMEKRREARSGKKLYK